MKKFCPAECNKEDEAWKILACRTCDHQEVAQHYVVNADQKLPRTKYVICPKCDHRGAEFCLLTTRSGKVVGLYCICCNTDCLHRFWDDDENAEK
nr:DNA-directed RNA polymerases II, IV and V subunit 9A [Ipomoea batatas]GME16527.1 DNA-directed RNA polymerases II, IV and V subunit 9A [Ipomoea batatas]